MRETVFALVAVVVISVGHSSRVATIPDGACLPITSPQPSGCPETIGPPCPRCYNNTMPDYTQGDSLELSAGTRNRMIAMFRTYVDLVLTSYPPTKKDTATVFSGHGGRALLFFKIYSKTANITYLETAREYIDMAVAHIGEEAIVDAAEGYTGFLWSHTGVAAVAAAIYNATGDIAKIDKYVKMVESAVQSKAGKYDDLDAGRSGLLTAAAFINTYYKPGTIALNDMTSLILSIVDKGAELMTPSADYLQWQGPNDNGLWLGTSHGSSGVIHQLLQTSTASGVQGNTSAIELIQKTISHTISTQFPSGNFPTEYFKPTDDVLVQWDHGAPGITFMLLRAYEFFNGSSFADTAMDSAVKAQECAWERGLLTKGLQLCHGMSGVAYSMIKMYQTTRDPKYLYRALQTQEFVFQYPQLYEPAQMRQPSPSSEMFNLWIGSYESALMLWTDMLFEPNADKWAMTGFSHLL